MSVSWPNMCTAMIARVLSDIAASTSSAPISPVSSDTSANRGIAPASTTASTVATKVLAGTMTSSPAPRSRARRARTKRVGSVSDPHRVVGAAVRSPLPLEGLDLLAADEPVRRDHLLPADPHLGGRPRRWWCPGRGTGTGPGDGTGTSTGAAGDTRVLIRPAPHAQQHSGRAASSPRVPTTGSPCKGDRCAILGDVGQANRDSLAHGALRSLQHPHHFESTVAVRERAHLGLDAGHEVLVLDTQRLVDCQDRAPRCRRSGRTWGLQ